MDKASDYNDQTENISSVGVMTIQGYRVSILLNQHAGGLRTFSCENEV